MIEVRQVTKIFHRGQPNELTALREVDLHIGAGEFVVVIGANGSGKSTLLNVIAGAFPPSTGRVLLHGRDVTDLPEYRRSRWVARVFQNPLGGTAPDLSILDNFRLAALRTQRKELRIGVNEAFKRRVRDKIAVLGLGLEDKLQQPMGTLSGGQRQALTLLMSTMDHTDILLLDEPTAALDPHSSEVVLQTADRLIHDLRLTTLLITHNLRDALRLGDRLLHMESGRILRDVSGEEKEKLTLEEVRRWFG